MIRNLRDKVIVIRNGKFIGTIVGKPVFHIRSMFYDIKTDCGRFFANVSADELRDV